MTMTQIKLLKRGDESHLEAFLLPRIDSSMFLLGNMRQVGIVDNGQRYSGSYAVSVEDDQITGVVAHYWNGNLICQAPPTQVADLCRAAVQTSGRPIKGVVGPAAQVEVARQAFGIEETVAQIDAVEQLYTLGLEEIIVPDALREGRVTARPIEENDLELLTEWRNGYSIESLNAVAGPMLAAESRSTMERSLRERTGWIVEAEGKPVAFTNFNAVLSEAVQVGGVWTPPEFRGRGYARAAVAASLLAARDKGVEKAVLFTEKENVPAQKAYQAIGFEEVGDYRLLLLKAAFDLEGA